MATACGSIALSDLHWLLDRITSYYVTLEIVFQNLNSKMIFTYISKNGNVVFDVKIDNETIWITQQQMADLFETTQQNISLQLVNIFDEKELQKNSVHKDYLYTEFIFLNLEI